MRTQYCRVGCLAFSLILLGAQVGAQSSARPRSDPRIRTELTASKQKVKADEAIIVDVYVENTGHEDIRQRQFSPISSSVGLPGFLITPAGRGEGISLSPGLFAETPDWDGWYQPASGRDAFRVGGFVLPAGNRIHLLHGDLRLMIEHAGEYCQLILVESKLLEGPEAAATKKYYEDVVRFAGQFRKGGVYELTVWAYGQSNTVRLEIEPSTN